MTVKDAAGTTLLEDGADVTLFTAQTANVNNAAGVAIPQGKYIFSLSGTSGTADVQCQMHNGVAWIDIVGALIENGPGTVELNLPACKFRANVANVDGTTTITAKLQRVGSIA